ncbi:hypothetical protein SCOR_08290 [Sulfidibacter corallicola]
MFKKGVVSLLSAYWMKLLILLLFMLFTKISRGHCGLVLEIMVFFIKLKRMTKNF